MDDAKREDLEKVCKNYKVRTRMIAVRMARVRNMLVEDLLTSWYGAPRGSAIGCVVTTKEILKVSGFFPDADGSEGFRKASWME